MALRPSEILQIDATVITGIFILLTITSSQLSTSALPLGKILYIITLAVIAPFALSAVIVGKLEMKKLKESVSEDIEKSYLHDGILLMAGGFAYLFVFLTAYVILALFTK